MDHALAAVALCGLAPPSPWIWGLVAIGSLAPDLDVVHGRPGTAAYLLHHRTYTHSVLGALVFAAIAAGLARIAGAPDAWVHLALWCLCGVCGHLVLDVLNSFGTMLLFPMARTRFAADLVFEFDPVITGLLSLAIGLERWPAVVSGATPLDGARFAGGLLASYLLLRVTSRSRFRRHVRHVAQCIPEPLEALSVVPAPFWRWKGIIATAGHHYVVRAPSGLLAVEVLPRQSLPSEFHGKVAVIYQNYARHLDAQPDGESWVLRNLVYSPSTYAMWVHRDDPNRVTHAELPRVSWRAPY